jgi:hypothetical protein
MNSVTLQPGYLRTKVLIDRKINTATDGWVGLQRNAIPMVDVHAIGTGGGALPGSIQTAYFGSDHRVQPRQKRWRH